MRDLKNNNNNYIKKDLQTIGYDIGDEQMILDPYNNKWRVGKFMDEYTEILMSFFVSGKDSTYIINMNDKVSLH